MGQERHEVSTSELARWVIIAALLVAGIAAYFWLAPDTEPVAPPAVQEPVQ